MRRKMQFRRFINGLIVFAVLWSAIIPLIAADNPRALSIAEIEGRVRELMEEGDIPGLSLVIVKGDEPVYLKGFGYADVDKKTPVTANTLFQLGSTSKAFTALAALKCEADGLINLEEPVFKYLPWFYVNYKGEKQSITLEQLLHHTSGIPTHTLSLIPVSKAEDALEKAARTIVGMELAYKPGEKFEYATINYDILGAVLQAATGMLFEDYVSKHILAPLGLTETRVGENRLDEEDGKHLSNGYKIGFFKARKFQAPLFRGNTPAGYIITNARDMARWLQFQVGTLENEFTPLIEKSHRWDRNVPPQANNMLSYAMGWMVALDGSGAILHSGQNPNFTSYIIFKPEDKTGVAIMANSNSSYTAFIGRSVMNALYGKVTPLTADLGDGMDKGSSLISFFLMFFLFCTFGYYVLILLGILKGKRRFATLSLKTVLKLILPLVLMIPFLAAIYILPRALAEFSWETALVWGPISFKTAVTLLLAAMGAGYIGYFFSTLFPQQNKYIHSIPMLILLSISSGAANAVVIFLITISLFTRTKLVYLIFYFGLVGVLYITGRKVLQTRLIKITNNLIYDLRMQLMEKIFSTSYQKFEKVEKGRILATLNNDTGQIGGSANLFVQLVSSIVTVIGAFIYLGTIAFWATIVTLVVVIIIATLYYVVSQKANVYFNEARNTQNNWMDLLRDLQDGYKELSLHYKKKTEFKSDVAVICNQFRNKVITALVKFVNAFMVGESLLIAVLGAVCFAVPHMFPEISTLTLMGFIMVLLYLIGPVNAILNSIPGIMQIRIAWNRVQQFLRDIPANLPPEEMALPPAQTNNVQNIKAEGILFEYGSEIEEERFAVGPLDFEINAGEIVFIIGGNGSGKTTLAKLLTGLYIPEKGSIKIDGKEISNHRLGEYFSVVFGDYHLFDKLYDIDLENKEQKANHYLELLRLKEKVTLEKDKNSFSTLDLSGGQRKRLALLQCYLEDRPIYLFDEIAADQDPEFRKFFYRDLLQKMKQEGKMVIAITHDDHYFDVADRVIKMDMGKIEPVNGSAHFSVTK